MADSLLRRAVRSVAVSALLMRERWRSGVAYNPLSAGVARDPYPVYAKLRERDPRALQPADERLAVQRATGTWTPFCATTGTSPATRASAGHRPAAGLPAFAEDMTMLFLDPPDHTRLRALVNKAFTRRAVNALEARVRGLMEGLLDAVADPAGFDWMEAVANPLPVIVIAEMLGVPPEDRARSGSGRTSVPASSSRRSPRGSVRSRGRRPKRSTRISCRSSRPGARRRGTTSSAPLVHAEEAGDTLTEHEMLMMLRLLLVAGNETTTNLFGNGLLALLRHRINWRPCGRSRA